MDPDVLWRLDLNGRVKSHGANMALDLYTYFSLLSPLGPTWRGGVRISQRKKCADFAYFHSTTVVSRPSCGEQRLRIPVGLW